MLDRGRCQLDVEVKTLMLIDSLELTPDHLKTIIKPARIPKKNKS